MPSYICHILPILCVLVFPALFTQEQPKLLLVSFDGFRWDYIYKAKTPNFSYIIQNGVHVKQVTNIFITKTFPNHYTLSTGLYAENHGIVANEMYDSVLNKTFSMNNLEIYDSFWWEEAYPIWVSNQMQGYKSGAAMWPGTDVKIHGMFPSHYMTYNGSVSFEYRINQLIKWFKSEQAINIGLLYWEEPDETGHMVGPDDPKMKKVIADIDSKLGYLIVQLKTEGLWDKLNVIITSDHGMAEVLQDRIIELDQYIDREMYTLVDHTPVVAILPKEGKMEEVYKALVHAHPNMTVYKKEEIPDHFHYKHNSRIQPIFAVVDNGWALLQNKSDGFLLGNHGYDNTLQDMHPIFVAYGPAFKKNYFKETMESVDLYPLMCHILGISPLPNNGSINRVLDLLDSTDPSSQTKATDSYSWVLGAVFGIVIVAVFLVIFIKQVTLSQLHTVQVPQSEMTQPLLEG
ncbi:ectonucleotide pyrophosphatase/phosphodiesterase family member 5 [Protopterus annectens]|uniref:ectonucleotide pyrophosphatase/phosphodiesterase family member 5 n=1 Tax=Protopterus annectens TaxID=7888 RepID=UPI001CF956C0|nr:ectonucleotide pyrophosphatase/phosphodiesterase family member 5 [Protopterus annectens]XP_043918579.1 ectonucleotide pyrophosphatase/phosphodiesterase family member 5 [Protopterus annectens]